MAGITRAEAEEQLRDWLAASKAVSKAQSYSVAGKTMTKADAEVIRENITYWNKEVKRLSRGGIRVRGATPSDG